MHILLMKMMQTFLIKINAWAFLSWALNLLECTVNSCQNGGICSVKEEGGYSCSCPIFYTGLNCEGNNIAMYYSH